MRIVLALVISVGSGCLLGTIVVPDRLHSAPNDSGGSILVQAGSMPLEPSLTGSGRVVKVIDGDTIEVVSEIRFRIRLIDCWCPETRTKDAAEKRRGQDARSFLTCIAHGRAVLYSIPFGKSLGDSITLGRVLARVRLADNQSIDLSSIMVEAGHASKSKE